MFGIIQIEKLPILKNITTWKINKFSEFFQFEKLLKFQKSQSCRFSYLPFDMNELRSFIFSILIFYCDS